MNKNKLIDTILIIIIVIVALFIVYGLVGLNNRSLNEYQSSIPFAPMVDGKQIMKMTVEAQKFSPEYFRLRSHIPAIWEITSSAQSFCDSKSIIAKDLTYGSPTQINPDSKVTVIEFLAPLPGLYRFYCSIGTNRIEGAIESNN